MTWKRESRRHSLSSRGISTVQNKLAHARYKHIRRIENRTKPPKQELSNIKYEYIRWLEGKGIPTSEERLSYWDIELDDVLQSEVNYIDVTIQAGEEDPSEVDFDDLFYSTLNMAQQDSNLSEEDYEEVEKLANYYYKEYVRYFHGDRRRPLYC